MDQTPNSNRITDGIRVRAAALYVPGASDPDAPYFLFTYRIRITNEGSKRVKLLSRHWIIKDAFNEREDVKGPGVIGEHPELDPGESYEYTSSCRLRTRWGTMEGSYQFEDLSIGGVVQVAIGRFFLVPSVQLKHHTSEC